MQVTARVRWRESVLYMKEQSVTMLTEIGVGKVLASLTKRIDRDMDATCIQSPEDIDAFFAGV
jgi:[acyl-carrier-protein] S-malonyltransferase